MRDHGRGGHGHTQGGVVCGTMQVHDIYTVKPNVLAIKTAVLFLQSKLTVLLEFSSPIFGS